MKKTVLITGASRGIGAACARLFAYHGCRVAINYHQSQVKAEMLCKEIIGTGGDAACFQADVANGTQVAELFRQVGSIYGNVDILVNNAGIAQQKLFTDVSEEEWDALFAVNVRGMFLCSKAALAGMIHQKSGAIVNISSMWGVTGASCEVPYSAAKAAVIGLTKALAKEVGPSGIRVNCVAPGAILTDMNAALGEETLRQLASDTPLERLGTPEDIANAVYFLASEESNFITGQVLGSNGGLVI